MTSSGSSYFVPGRDKYDSHQLTKKFCDEGQILWLTSKFVSLWCLIIIILFNDIQRSLSSKIAPGTLITFMLYVWLQSLPLMHWLIALGVSKGILFEKNICCKCFKGQLAKPNKIQKCGCGCVCLCLCSWEL